MTYLGIDIGTSGVKALLIDRAGSPLGEATAKAVEPTTSAKRQVTILRSPARWAARIFSTSGAGVFAARRVWRGGYACLGRRCWTW